MSEPFDPYHKWLGIPFAEQPPDHYRLLGLARFESDPDAIAHAADQRMAHLKTFQAGRHSAQSQRLLNEVAAAKLTLLGPARKAAYDAQLRPNLAVAPAFGGGRLGQLRDLCGDPRFGRRAAATIAAGVLLVAVVTLVTSVRHGPEDPPPRPSQLLVARSNSGERRPAMAAAGAEAPAAIGVEPWPQSPALPARNEPSAPKTIGQQPLPQPCMPDAPPAADPPPAPAVRAAASEPTYLDDLQEVGFQVGLGILGKHGQTGYPKHDNVYGERVRLRGTLPAHALSLHPPANGSSCVAYAIQGQFQTLRATAAVLEPPRDASTLAGEPLFMGRAYSPLRFRIFGDGALLWESQALETCGVWEECKVSVAGVRLLELQVACQGLNWFAWAAWIDPLLTP